MKDNLVSIIMPCFDSEQFISTAIDSVIAQTYSNWELLICDDSSSDKSVEIIRNYANADKRISLLFNNHQKGAPGARNTCIENASGRFLAFLDSDDCWFDDRLETHLEFIKKNSVAFSYTYNDVINENGEYISTYKAPSILNKNTMRFANFISCSTAIIDRVLVGDISQPFIKKRNDYALWLKILNSNKIKNAYCFKRSTSMYRSNSYGLSSNKFDALRYHFLCLNIYAKQSKFNSIIYVIVYIFLVLLKKKMTKAYNFFIVRV